MPVAEGRALHSVAATQTLPAFDPALSCFFNALIRESADWRFAESAVGPTIHFPLSAGRSLLLPCQHLSHSARHRLCGPAFIERPGTAPEALTLAEAVTLVLEQLGGERVAALRQRVLQSAANTADALVARQGDMECLFSAPLDFIEAESALLVGHSVHPCPKARDRFSAADARAFAPEYRGAFALLWLAVKRSRVRQYSAAAEHMVMVEELATRDSRLAQWLRELGEDEWLLPCHPYQWPHWQAQPVLARALAAGELRLLGEGALRWRATSSLRALYCEQVPWMLKFSLNVKLTNSVRQLQPEELVRGAQLAAVLQSPEGQAFQARFPRFEILSEPAAVILLDDNSTPLVETGSLWRANPFVGAGAAHTEVLATLLQDDPRDGLPRLVKRLQCCGAGNREGAQRWFAAYLDVAVRPLLLAQADYGLLFGCHQQNIVLTLDDIWPVKACFRDCQGTGFSPLAQRRLPAVPEGATQLDAEMGQVLFTYYLFVNATFNVISSLAMSGWIAEAALLAQLRQFLQSLLDDGVEDDSVIRNLLHSQQLHIKGNFHCALSDLNENTQRDILAMYHPISNPLTSIQS